MSSIWKSVSSAVFVLALLGPGCASAPAQAPCTYTAALSGSDHSRGSASRPFHSVQRLVDRLRPGQTGCVRGGTYQESVTISQGGSSAGARVMLERLPRRTRNARRAPVHPSPGAVCDGRKHEPQRTQPPGAAIAGHRSGKRSVHRQRRDRRTHRNLLHPRLAFLRTCEKHADRPQPDPRLRPRAGAERRSRHLRGLRRQHAHCRQRDLQERRPGDPAVSRRTGNRDRTQHPRQQRRGHRDRRRTHGLEQLAHRLQPDHQLDDRL